MDPFNMECISLSIFMFVIFPIKREKKEKTSSILIDKDSNY